MLRLNLDLFNFIWSNNEKNTQKLHMDRQENEKVDFVYTLCFLLHTIYISYIQSLYFVQYIFYIVYTL